MNENAEIEAICELYKKQLTNLRIREEVIKSVFQAEARRILVGKMVRIKSVEGSNKNVDVALRVKDVLPLKGFDGSFQLISEIGTGVVVDEECMIKIME